MQGICDIIQKEGTALFDSADALFPPHTFRQKICLMYNLTIYNLPFIVQFINLAIDGKVWI
jgi:hypothetical protein